MHPLMCLRGPKIKQGFKAEAGLSLRRLLLPVLAQRIFLACLIFCPRRLPKFSFTAADTFEYLILNHLRGTRHHVAGMPGVPLEHFHGQAPAYPPSPAPEQRSCKDVSRENEQHEWRRVYPNQP
jgi:hypothetical protein